MHLTRPAVSLAAATAAAALLLAGCGGGDDGDSKSDKIEGADSSKDKSPSPKKNEGTQEKEPDFRTSDIELPDDVKLVFDWDQPSDPDKAAALDGAADYMRVVRHGMVKDRPKDPLIAAHTVPLQDAQDYATYMMEQHAKKNYTVTGSERFYKEQVGDAVDGKLVEVAFCSDQRKIFSKQIKTGKVIRNTGAPEENFLRFSVVMQKPSEGGAPWKARSVDVTEKAVKQCKEQ
ncbi:hypothetical protein JW613_27810 [Streptomyces smyrnaeus]|uniref:Lipoprotein n=1 Tax=Streptomyces smyrnaeus TaxID=1387713 RepID=A0ABS3Y4M2_9ACTN|nr:hypothetical protein [Streptomyces smyrnaeus]MBO8202072.1 hypothetical protein [Streptomyces smyrnaeus]